MELETDLRLVSFWISYGPVIGVISGVVVGLFAVVDGKIVKPPVNTGLT